MNLEPLDYSPHDLRPVINIIEALLAVSPRLHMSQGVALLTVAARPGITVTELGKETNMLTAAASRAVGVLSDASSGKRDGLGLISVDRARDTRLKPLRLTKHGQDLVKKLTGYLPTASVDTKPAGN